MNGIQTANLGRLISSEILDEADAVSTPSSVGGVRHIDTSRQRSKEPEKWLYDILDHPRSSMLTLDMVGWSRADKSNIPSLAANGDRVAIRKMSEMRLFVFAAFTELRVIEYTEEKTVVKDGVERVISRKVRRPYWVPEPVESKKDPNNLDIHHGTSADIVNRVMQRFEDWLAQSYWLDFNEVTEEDDRGMPRPSEREAKRIRESYKYKDAFAWADRTMARIREDLAKSDADAKFRTQLEAKEHGRPPVDPDADDPLLRAGLAPIKNYTQLQMLDRATTIAYCEALGLDLTGNMKDMKERIEAKLDIKPAKGAKGFKRNKDYDPGKVIDSKIVAVAVK